MADDKARQWAAWGRAETRRLQQRQQKLLQEMGSTWEELFPPGPRAPAPPWVREAVEQREPSDAEMQARTAQMFTGKGGLGSFGGEFYDIHITRRGASLQHAKSIPVFGTAPEKAFDPKKYYDGREFEEFKRGGYGGEFYDVRIKKDGTRLDRAQSTPLFGPPSQKVVARTKFYHGKEFAFEQLGQYGGNYYDVKCSATGTPRGHARNTPIFGRGKPKQPPRPATAPPRPRAVHARTDASKEQHVRRVGSQRDLLRVPAGTRASHNRLPAAPR